MILANEFTVAAPVRRTWETLLEVERVAGCLPGASVRPVGEDGAYRGTLKLKVGPVTMAYEGTVRLHEADESSWTVIYDAAARETSGPGTAAALITARLTSNGAGTHVGVDTELNVTGRAAQFARGMMEDVARRTLDRFASSLQGLLEEAGATIIPDGGGAGAAPPGEVLDLTPGLWSTVSGRPALVGVLVAGALALVMTRRRRRRVELTLIVRLR